MHPNISRVTIAGIFVFGIVAGLVIAHWPSSDRVNAQGPTWSARKFYLTKTGVQGNQALTACSAGYHMASFWEIFDVSGLQYDTSLGVMSEDSGGGPPTNIKTGLTADGWIRTGGIDTVGGNPGFSNCKAWTSNLAGDDGSVIRLSPIWRTIQPGSQIVTPWQNLLDTNAGPPLCNTRHRVWCVQN